jgi:uncharacterized protein
MIFKRDLAKTLIKFSKFPVIGVFGPRHSGKTTLVKNVFENHTYLNFEDPILRAYALENPRGFLKEYENKKGLILDEFQYVPEILSYIQIESDPKDRPGYFILTGSQNFLMNQAITQSLAGRIGILNLLPLSINELQKNGLPTDNSNELVFSGGYPRLYAKDILPTELYPSYINSYVERDIRLLVNVENLATFQKFMQLCAGRIGQLLNISDLATSCGITQKTVQSWLSILQASYIVFLLQPYHANFNKRVTKTPKLFFYDTGLACSLLNIRSSQELALSSFKGHLFECCIVADIFKQYYSIGTTAPIYFWRDMNGRIEIDCLLNLGSSLVPIEIKSGEGISTNYFDSLSKWNEIAKTDPTKGYVIYAGEHIQRRTKGNLIGWQQSGNLIKKLEHQRE